MSDINNFGELTDFISVEYAKMTDTFGAKRPSDRFIKFTERNLIRYARTYDKTLYAIQKMQSRLLYREQKLEYQIDVAIFTMPHGKLWQLCHPRLWPKVQERLNATKAPPAPPEPPVDTIYPAVLKPQDVPLIADEIV